MSKPTKEERDNLVSEILNQMYVKAVDETFIVEENPYEDLLNPLFNTTTWGYREILLVVYIGMKLDVNYRATSALYDCNPRAIYEGPIKDFLIEHKIPHRKSGPLNIAKATPGLDENWASQRRPSDLARNVVNIVNLLEQDNTNQEELDDFAVLLLRKFLENAKKTESLSFESAPSSDPNVLVPLTITLIKKAPDGGNTPQRIFGYLLNTYHDYLNTGIVVTGYEDSASTTSTTSKKPGDINEEKEDGSIHNIYEVTVKPFDLNRIRDSFDSLLTYNQENSSANSEIIGVCRKEDTPSFINKCASDFYFGNYVYQGVTYFFIDIFEWISR